MNKITKITKSVFYLHGFDKNGKKLYNYNGYMKEKPYRIKLTEVKEITTIIKQVYVK